MLSDGRWVMTLPLSVMISPGVTKKLALVGVEGSGGCSCRAAARLHREYHEALRGAPMSPCTLRGKPSGQDITALIGVDTE